MKKIQKAFWAIALLTSVVSCKKEITPNHSDFLTTVPRAVTASPAKVSLGYLTFSQWINYTWNDIDYSSLTHIVASFMSAASSTNPQVVYSGDANNDFINFPLTDKSFGGYMNQLVPKAHSNGVKVMVALNNASVLKNIFANSSLRASFVTNLITTCKTYGFDGVDLDYEYPTSSAEGTNIKNFITELYNAAQADAAVNKPFSITMAVAFGNFASQYLDFNALSNYCDWYNVMTYDYDATWTTVFGHNAPLYKDAASPHNNNCNASIMDYYKNQRGIPANKLVLGLPFYGYKYSNYTYLYGSKTTSNGDGLKYSDVYFSYLNKPGWVRNWSSSAQVPYLVNSGTGQMISYDDSASIAIKCDYASNNYFRGVMVWELSRGFLQGVTPSQPLLKVMGDKVVRNANYGADNIISGATYKITTALNGTSALDVYGAGTADGSNVIIWNYGGGANQKWKVTKLANGNYKLNPAHALTKALNVNGGGSADGTAVNIWTDNGSTAQQWAITSLGSGQFTLSPVCAPGKMLDITGGNTNNGTAVIIWYNNGGTNQKFNFTKL